ncbi:hypothetical protein Tco_1575918 [Tanacetum coccineum]
MNGRTYQCVLCYLLGIPLFTVPKPCSACSRVFIGDIYGDHVVSCTGIIGIKYRHNIVRDTLVDICFRSGISVGKEVDIGLGGGREKPLRSADMLLYSWDGWFDICVDLIGSSPLTQDMMIDFLPGHARDAVTLLKWIQMFSVTQDIDARTAVHISSRISFSIVRGWDRGLDVCVDLTGSSPLTQTWMADFVPGRAVINVAHHKRVKYEIKCATIGYGFLPFSFSSLGN